MSMSFDMDAVPLAQRRTAGLAENQCYPQTLINEPSFALLNNDPYFDTHQGHQALWANPPDANLIAGKTPTDPPTRKRDLSVVDMIGLVFDNGTFSKLPTDEQLDDEAAKIEHEEALILLEKKMEQFAYVECKGEMCATQATLIGRYVENCDKLRVVLTMD
jgi:hypothetical protein